jgi:hypothetical protein
MTGTVIPAAAAIIVAALTWFFSRHRDRESLWRATKLKYYEEFVISLSGVVGQRPTIADKARWAHACNALHLVASPKVLSRLYTFQEATKPAADEIDVEKQDRALAALVWDIRSDLGLPTHNSELLPVMRLWAPPVDQE